MAIDGPILTIRKFSDRICSLDELVALGSLPLWYAQLLSCAVSLRQDLAVAGGTGSGKTTLLNALSCEISTGERIVTIATERRDDAVDQNANLLVVLKRMLDGIQNAAAFKEGRAAAVDHDFSNGVVLDERLQRRTYVVPGG